MKLLKHYIPKSIIIICILLISQGAQSQDERHNFIKKSAILSIACPGLGQIQNKKHWKVPIIYIGLSGAVYSYVTNNQKYQEYKSAYISETDGDQNTINMSGYSASNLITLENYYRNSRDLSGLVFFLIYFLNIIDASVDAHLANYNLNDNLSLSLNRNNDPTLGSINLYLTWDL